MSKSSPVLPEDRDDIEFVMDDFQRSLGKVNQYVKCNFWESHSKVKNLRTLPIRPGLKANLF